MLLNSVVGLLLLFEILHCLEHRMLFSYLIRGEWSYAIPERKSIRVALDADAFEFSVRHSHHSASGDIQFLHFIRPLPFDVAQQRAARNSHYDYEFESGHFHFSHFRFCSGVAEFVVAVPELDSLDIRASRIAIISGQRLNDSA